MQMIQDQQKKGKVISLSVAAIILLTLSFWVIKTSASIEKTRTSAQAIRTIRATQSDGNTPIEISGFVRGQERADVAPVVSGRILKITKSEGESVKKGEVIAIIDASQSNAQVQAATTSVEAMQKTLSDSKKYYDQLIKQAKDMPDSSTTDQAIKSAEKGRDLQVSVTQGQLIAARGALETAKAGNGNFFLTAPFSGIITTIYARQGGLANFSMPIFTISTTKGFEIETYVSAENSRNIAIGQTVSLKSKTGAPIIGKVINVSPGSDPMSLKTFIRISLDSSLDMLHLGDFIHGEILVPGNKNTILIPRNAVVSRGGDQIVFILKNNDTVKEESIKIIGEHDGLIEISEGIKPDQEIVIEGQQYLVNGSKTTPYETK